MDDGAVTGISENHVEVHFRLERCGWTTLRGDGYRWAGETVRGSENCTIRLIVVRDGGSAAARQTVLETFHRLGTTGEGIERFRMVALDVPPDADLPRIRKLLEHGEAEGWWHWEEGCVTTAWRAAAIT